MSKQLEAPIDIDTVISRDPEIHSGDLVFAGTRVPVSTLIAYLKGGDSVDFFLDGFPTVERWQIEAFLDLSPEAIEAMKQSSAHPT